MKISTKNYKYKKIFWLNVHRNSRIVEKFPNTLLTILKISTTAGIIEDLIPKIDLLRKMYKMKNFGIEIN